MQKIIFLLIFNIIVQSIFAQSYTSVYDSSATKTIEIQTLDQQIFSSKNIQNLPIINKIIVKKESNIKSSYIFLFFLNLVFIAVLLTYTFQDKIYKLTNTIFSINILTQYTKTEQKRDNSYLWLYLVLVFIALMLFIYTISFCFKYTINFEKLSLFLLSFFVLDLLIHKATSYLFTIQESINMIHFNNFSFLIIVLPFLFISILITLFIHIDGLFFIQYIIFTLLLLLYFWKEIRNLFILKSNRINIYSFYFFLYLCTFKVAPLIIFSKIIFSKILKNPIIN